MEDRDGQLISPRLFLESAERFGLAVPIDYMAIRKAVRKAVSLSGQNIWISLNLALYRSSPQAGAQPIAKAGRLVAPHRIGGLRGSTIGAARFESGLAGTGNADLTDKYLDYGVDSQYEKKIGESLLSVHANYLRERRTLSASEAAGLAANSDGTLNRFKLDGTVHWGRRYASTLGAFAVTGAADDLLYAPAAITGSASGKPNTDGWTGQLTYLPWQNTQFALQYTAYTKFNGARTNYDVATVMPEITIPCICWRGLFGDRTASGTQYKGSTVALHVFNRRRRNSMRTRAL